MKRKQIKISTAIPAELSGFVIKGNSHLSSAKLKVFHTGMTSDGRTFTKKFADKIAATIGGTPIVARYDEEKDDFKGHHHSQSVFGFVPEVPVIGFESDGDGNTWLVTDVRLFTERHDVGRIAKKIIGQPQSLELDPESVRVDFIYGDDDELERMDFQDGDLIGLSVLGLDQSPAFTGSGFFSKAPEADELKQLIAKYNTIPKEVVIETGGELMDKEMIFETDGFEIYREDNRIFVNNVKDGALDDITDAVTPVIIPATEIEDIATENPVDPVDPIDEEAAEEEEEDLPEALSEDAEPEVIEDPVEEPEEEAVTEDEATDAQDPTDEGDGDEFESEEETQEPVELDLEPETEESASDTSALSKEERNELENYRRNDKINIINGYSEYLSEAQLQEFKTKVDEFDIDNLEKELSFVSMQSLKNKTNTKPSFSFDRSSARETDSLTDAFSKYI